MLINDNEEFSCLDKFQTLQICIRSASPGTLKLHIMINCRVNSGKRGGKLRAIKIFLMRVHSTLFPALYRSLIRVVAHLRGGPKNF